MASYGEMTKDELLEQAQSRGLTPANAGMTKAELVEALETDDADDAGAEDGEPEVDQQVTTTMTKDYLGVPLVNPTPGTSQATDRLGRSVVSGNKDYMNRALVA